MTAEEMNAGFHNLAALQSRDEKYATSIAGCVHFNARILNDVVARLDLVAGRVGIAENELAKQQVTTDAIKAAVAGALDLVHEKDIAADTKLRHELDEMAARLEAGHSVLQSKINELNMNPALPPGIAPGLAPNIDMVATKVRI